MARQPDVQYINMYNYGNTARKLESQQPVRKKRYQLPQQATKPHQNVQRKQEPGLVLDPLSLCAVGVAGLLLVCLMIGMLQIGVLNSRRQELEGYISTLQSQRADLQITFDSVYDLEQVERRAAQMGMVHISEARHISVNAPVVEETTQPGFWTNTKAVFAELFAKAPH